MPQPSTMRRDVASAYLATGAKVASWALITALVYRQDRGGFALLALVRGTLGLLNYTSLGLGPAMIRLMAEAQPARAEPLRAELAERVPTLTYHHEAHPDGSPIQRAYSSGLFVALATSAVGLGLILVYAAFFDRLHALPTHYYAEQAFRITLWMGVGTLLRLASDAASAVLQTRRQIALDNRCLIAADVSWILWTAVAATSNRTGSGFVWSATDAAGGFAFAGLVLFVARSFFAYRATRLILPRSRFADWSTARWLLGFGVLVSLAQLADFLYAPTDFILINHYLSAYAVATYAPAVQIDGALLLFVGGLSTVLLPRAALAYATGDRTLLKRYYLTGTAAGSAMLLAAAIVVWLLAPVLLRVWLGDHWAVSDTLVILPLVLIHTVIGGSGAVGRAILLGMGKVKPFAASVLIAGVANVLLSIFFVKYLNLGLRGIIYGTILAVIGRCVLWMPWYVLRTIKRAGAAVEQTPFAVEAPL